MSLQQFKLIDVLISPSSAASKPRSDLSYLAS
jgi:hypothetical protein